MFRGQIQVSGFTVQGVRVSSLGFSVSRLGFRVSRLGFGAEGWTARQSARCDSLALTDDARSTLRGRHLA